MNSLRKNPYFKQSEKYLSNADFFISKGEFRKASEMLWGAVTQLLKAIASIKGFKIRSHKQFWDFVMELAKELKDPSLFFDFHVMEKLHENFYDEKIPKQYFDLYYNKSLEYINKLKKILWEIVESRDV